MADAVDSDAVESPTRLAPDQRTADDRVLPSLADPVAREGSIAIGGPVGLHAVVGRSRTFTPLRVLLLLTLVALALGWYGKAACLQQAPNPQTGVQQLDWSNHRQYIALCYSDTVPLYTAERLDTGALPYKVSWTENKPDGSPQERRMEYPVLTGMYMYGAAQVAMGWQWAHDHWGVPSALSVVLFFVVSALGLALFWLVTIWATALTAGVRIWSAAIAAVSPLVIVHAFTNFDTIATAFLALAMLAWARRNPWAAGLFIGLGAAAKLYPALLLIPLAVLCLRAGKVREFFVTASVAAATWLVVNLPVMALFPAGWYEFFRYNSSRGTDPDTWFTVVTRVSGYRWGADVNGSSALVNALFVGLFVVVCIAVAAIGLTAPTRPRVAQLMFLILAGFLLVNKVWSPQYSLWLVPLAVLAIPRFRLLMAWMVLDAAVWIPRMGLYLPADVKWLPDQWFTAAIVLRFLAVLGLCAVVIWEIYHPRADLVRAGVDGRRYDDPAGGVLDEAPDSVVSRRPRPAETATAVG
ncbi:glycosyltransferase family 87 protein [Williamsia deligens]|uniref:Glycosyltransferase family 87 protein n=1 Tax=Williamsia deligens TaxID=321325 RepID=A0ABW3G940_9NOCA|nr:glycosyltransferase 87 family protein [Williamsia deligens]MCP2193724.1 putative membrane protein [Williamsia deligens]